MNPFYYLHLPDSGVDIRGSQIALSFRYAQGGKMTAMLAVSFVDGRWPKTVQEPELHIKEVLSDSEYCNLASDPFFIHVIYFTSAARWWTNALDSIHEQLIAYVRIEDSNRVVFAD